MTTENPGILLKRLVTWTAGLALFVTLLAFFLFGYVLYDRHETSERGIEQRRTLCAEIEKLKNQRRGELQEDIEQAERFLRDNPGGISGIPASLIRDSIDRDKTRQRALAPIDCESFARKPPTTQPTRGVR